MLGRSRARLASLLIVSASAACGGKPKPRPTPAPAQVLTHAVAGDTIYVVEHIVRPDRRAQFERFLEQSYWPAARQIARTDPAVALMLRQTRVIYPLRANDDGTYTYLFLMDPVVHGETYNIHDLLSRVYDAAETERRYRELTESWARPFQSHPYVQPRFPTQP
jgi:hypothetical protein